MKSATRALVVILFLAIAPPGSVSGQSSDGARKDLTSAVDRIFAPADRKDAPGCALSIVRDGKVLYQRGYGMANLDHDIPITTSTVFAVGSISKQFTATAILLLAQENKLSLDDDVRKYLPEVPDFHERITIRHLLHHTSGVRDQLQLLALSGWRYTQDLYTDKDILGLIARQKALNFQPGSEHMYSNTNYTLLAQIVKRVSGKSFREFTTARIFEPLGMTRTRFRDNFREIVKNQAYGYVALDLIARESGDADRAAAARVSARSGSAFEIDTTNSDNVGPSGLVSTVEDLAMWDENFYQPKVGGKELIQQLLQKGRLNHGEEIFYALGLGIEKYRGLNIVEHPGTDAGYAAEILRFPDQHFSVICACNRAGSAPANLARRIADLYLADKLEPVPEVEKVSFTPASLTDAQMSTYPGLYIDEKDQTFIRIARKRDQSATLLIRREEFLPRDAEYFHSTSGPMALEFKGGNSTGWAQLVARNRDGIRTLTRVPEYSPSAAQLKEYAGDYRSEEIDPVFRISMDQGKLTLSRLKADPAAMEPMTADLFQLGSRVTVRFVRNDKRQVTGFLYTASRIRNMAFERKLE